MKLVIRNLTIYLYLFLIFYLVVLLFLEIDILIKMGILVLLFVLYLLYKDLAKVINSKIDFFSSIGTISSISIFSVYTGTIVSHLLVTAINMILNSSKYIIEDTNENIAFIKILGIILIFYLSYHIFKLIMAFLKRIKIWDVELLTLTEKHSKHFATYTVFFGFVPFLATVDTEIEVVTIINKYIVGAFFAFLIPYIYFLFNGPENQ